VVITVSVLNMASSTSHVRNDSSHAPWMSVLNTKLHASTSKNIMTVVTTVTVHSKARNL